MHEIQHVCKCVTALQWALVRDSVLPVIIDHSPLLAQLCGAGWFQTPPDCMLLAFNGSMRLTGSGVQGLSSRQEVGLGQKTPSSLPDLHRTVFSHPGPVPPSTPGQLLTFSHMACSGVAHRQYLQVCMCVAACATAAAFLTAWCSKFQVFSSCKSVCGLLLVHLLLHSPKHGAACRESSAHLQQVALLKALCKQFG